MGRFIDRTGETVGRLTAIKVAKEKQGNMIVWLCSCSCGNPQLHRVSSCNWGTTQSCGCLRNEATIRRNYVHGASFRGDVSHEYALLMHAKGRASKASLPIDIDHLDIVIPTKCPVLGIKLRRNKKRQADNSATLDRINPELGYVKGNIWVISQRANRIKNDASINELERLYEAIEKEIKRDKKIYKVD